MKRPQMTALELETLKVLLQKFRATQRALTVSTALVGGVVLFSVVFAWILGSRVTRRVEVLRDAGNHSSGDEGRRKTCVGE